MYARPWWAIPLKMLAPFIGLAIAALIMWMVS